MQSDPIIILQSDEGPDLTPWRSDARKALDETATARWELEEQFGILNAYHLPEMENTGLYQEVSPVNSLRLVFNLYFDARLPLLPDRSYIFSSEEEPYRFIDVTERVKDRGG
jgi:hypothetical protein